MSSIFDSVFREDLNARIIVAQVELLGIVVLRMSVSKEKVIASEGIA